MEIDRLEQSQQDQQDIDSVYSTWCHFVRQNMYSSVPYKRVSSGYNTKRHKPGKPWWNNNLSDLWSCLSQAERSWLKGTGLSEKARHKSEYVSLRKSFDREVQRCETHHWYSLQSELEQECNTEAEMCSDERPVPDRNRSLFEDNFSILEVKKAVRSAKRGKSCDFDEISSEVLNNDASIYL